jgi:peptide-methionine (S)-S-oxide reductase
MLVTSSPQTLVLGGGCFWCTEAVFKDVRGITDVESGYSNGQFERPSYEDVCTGRTGCNEVVKLSYDPTQISTREILEIFFVIHDPTTLNRQGNDAGTQYRSGIYFTTPEQKAVADDLIREMSQDNCLAPPSSPRCCRWRTTGRPRTTTRISSRRTPTRATAWPWPRPRWPSSARPSQGWRKAEPFAARRVAPSSA